MRKLRIKQLWALVGLGGLLAVACSGEQPAPSQPGAGAAIPTPNAAPQTRPALPAGPIVIQPGAAAQANLAIAGWGGPQRDHRWTTAKSARLRLPAEAGSARRVSLRGRAIVPMDIDLLLNDVYFGTFRSDGRRILTQEFPITASMFKPGENILEFRVPQLASPASLDPKNQDKRQLGLMVKEIVLLP